MRVGLVLGAGGYAGHAFHAGVLTGLRDHTGWQPRHASHIVGTSAGSVVGAMLRGGLDLERIARGMPSDRDRDPDRDRDRERERERRLSSRPGLSPMRPGLALRGALPPWSVRPGVMGASLLPAGRVPLDGLAHGIDRLYGDGWPDQSLWIVALNIETGARVVFGAPGEPTVSVGTAVAASCAIPGWFAPPLVDGDRHVDGGAHSPTNADLLARNADGLDLDLIVVSSPMSVAGGHYQPSSALNLRGTLRRLLRREITEARRASRPVLTFQPTAAVLGAMGLNGMDPSRFDEVYEVTRDAVARRLADGRVHALVGAALDRLASSDRT